jgi:GT2 family glycosyltransferase
MTGTTPTYAVIPTEGRPCLHDCAAALRDQVDGIIAVANGGYNGTDLRDAYVIRDRNPVPNISRWWNIGLETVRRRMERDGELWQDRWNVLVVNDDTVMAPGSVATLTAGLRKYDGAQLAFPGLRSAEGLMRHPNPIRITGWCFALRGEAGLRADEELAWWAGDNDLDWRARQSGGTVVVPGVEHQHLHPNGYTVARPDLTEQAGKDMARFVEKWGRPAW